MIGVHHPTVVAAVNNFNGQLSLAWLAIMHLDSEAQGLEWGIQALNVQDCVWDVHLPPSAH